MYIVIKSGMGNTSYCASHVREFHTETEAIAYANERCASTHGDYIIAMSLAIVHPVFQPGLTRIAEAVQPSLGLEMPRL